MDIEKPTDKEGYLVDPDDWNADVAMALAETEKLELVEGHWPVLHRMREYYYEHRIAPDIRHMMKFVADENECNKKEAKQIIFKLFPYGYVKQACKLAGMKRPRAWSSG
ncbi:MAG: TusE/DsrC/DsvC family sulfur relay protein [Gammaproteobacteria bacterium]|nr:TusE/DsrC/DsvC family sulfur relay protein [Gammaproteobacteria bacterium]